MFTMSIVPRWRKVVNMGQKLFRNKFSLWIPLKKNKVHVLKTLRIQKPCTFQQTLRVTLIIGLLFSLIPVSGILSNNAADVRFTVVSWRFVYSLLSLCGQIFMTMLCLMKIFRSDSMLNETTPFIFTFSTCITMGMFIQLARSWPRLVQHIAATEDMDPSFDKFLVKKCNVMCITVLVLALLELILSLLPAFAGAIVCLPDKGLYEAFVIHFYPWVFYQLPYSVYLGVLIQFLHFQSTLIGNYSDLFVMCMSCYLTSRLEHINAKLLAAQGKYLPEIFWRRMREDYCRITQLVRRVDEVISGIVLVSFATNLFFICLQLFNTVQNGIRGTEECSSRFNNSTLLGGYEAAVYFLFSLVYLITRSVAVSLIASQINIASYVPVRVLYAVPSPVYCVEVQRFLDQVHGDEVALTGLQFFSITRSLLLAIAGTIVTYELVMFQFTLPSFLAATISPTITTSTSSMP